MSEENNKEFEEQINQAAEGAYEEEFERVNKQLEKEIVFAMVGDVNAGKSSTINALMGEEVATFGAAPGETKKIHKYPYKDKIIFADTPGLDDINQEYSDETKKFYKEADIILFFLNAAGTVFSEGEKRAFEQISRFNKDIIIVLNKIDAADDIGTLVKYIQDHTNHNYSVTPISSRTGENIEMLRKAILQILKKKDKDLQFAKNMKDKSSTANRWILGAASSAGAIGALPVPGSDIVPLTTIQVGMMVRLSTLYDRPLSKENAKELALATIAGNLGKTLFRQAVKVVPGAGSVAGAGVAAGMTLGLGYAVKYAYENDIDLDTKTIRTLYQMVRKKGV